MLNHREYTKTYFFCCALAALLLGNGCSTTLERDDAVSNGSHSNRFLHAARTAFYDYGTWPLLLGAAAFRANDYDSKVADYAMEHRPLFSESDTAARETDDLRSFTDVLTFGTAVAVDEGWEDKGKRALVESGAIFATRFTTTQMNAWVNREYPDGSGNDAFGSHHAASPFAAAALTRRNVASIEMPRWAKISINASSYAAATASAWGRIEMGLHYPSDQLVSAAVGNFIAIFLHDVFLQQQVTVNLSILPDSRYLALRIPFN